MRVQIAGSPFSSRWFEGHTFFSGEPTDVKQSHLSRRLSRSAAISHSGGIDFASIGPSVINVKKLKHSLLADVKRQPTFHMWVYESVLAFLRLPF